MNLDNSQVMDCLLDIISNLVNLFIRNNIYNI